MRPSFRSSAGEHELYCCGARVLVKDGKVNVLTEPRVSHCPLHEALYGVNVIDRVSVKQSIEKKIREFGFCRERRLFQETLIVPYGSSEIISVCMRKGLLDCAVTVCDGAGTVITSNPALVQGIGARLSGLIRTSPIAGTIKQIKTGGGMVLDEASARIDQAEGVFKAVELGFRRIAVTVAGFTSESIEEIRRIPNKKPVRIAIFSICNTCAQDDDVRRIIAGADVVCASASQLIRERVGPKALVQLGLTIPVFALTRLGKELLLSYLMEFNESIVAFRSRNMPHLVEGRGPRLKQ